MYVTDLEIRDLRSFRGTQQISLDRGDGTYAGWTVFAGRNGAGKSTLLKALALSIVGPLAARSLAGSFPAWVRKGAAAARMETRLAFDAQLDGFQGSGNTPSAPYWLGLEWKANPGGSDAVDRRVDNCSRCNSNHKRTRFPLANGVPALLDPASDSDDDAPIRHLRLTPTNGKYTPIGPKGEPSIRMPWRTTSSGQSSTNPLLEYWRSCSTWLDKRMVTRRSNLAWPRQSSVIT